MGYADRQPTQTYLDNYYKSYYDELERKTVIRKDILANHLKNDLNIINNNEQFSFLDFGGGDASISCELAEKILGSNKKMKIKICVIDPNFETPPNINSNINIYNLSSIAAIPINTKFDFVLASGILEHLKEHKEVLKKLLHLLKPSSRFYSRTPYIFPFMSLFYKIGINIDVHYPAHLYDMGSKFWNSVLNTLDIEGGFQIIRSSPSLVGSSVKEQFFSWIIAYVFKFPSKFFRKHYHFVGGWEVLIKRKR